MTVASIRLVVGTKIFYDREVVEIIALQPGSRGNTVVLRNQSGLGVRRVAVEELFSSCDPLLPVCEFITQQERSEGE